MTGSFWWDLLLGMAAALLLAWLALVIGLVIARPRGGLLREALRLLPDVLRLVRRLATDPTLPRGLRIRLGLLLAYLAMPDRPDPRLHPGPGIRGRRDHRHRRAAQRRPPRRPRRRSRPLARHRRWIRRNRPAHRAAPRHTVTRSGSAVSATMFGRNRRTSKRPRIQLAADRVLPW